MGRVSLLLVLVAAAAVTAAITETEDPLDIGAFIESITGDKTDSELDAEVEADTESETEGEAESSSEITIESAEVFQHLNLLKGTRATLEEMIAKNGMTVAAYNKILSAAKRQGAMGGGMVGSKGFFDWLGGLVDAVAGMLDKLNVVKWWECNRCPKCIKLVRWFQQKVVDFFLGDIIKIRDEFLKNNAGTIRTISDIWATGEAALKARKQLLSLVVGKVGEMAGTPVCAVTVTAVAAVLCGAITAPIPIPGSTLLICTPFLSWVQGKCEGFMGKAIKFIFDKISGTPTFLELAAAHGTSSALTSTAVPGVSDLLVKFLDGSFSVADLDEMPYIGSKPLCESVGLCPVERTDCNGEGALFTATNWASLTSTAILQLQETAEQAAREAATSMHFPAPDCFKRNLYSKSGSLIKKETFIRGIGDCTYPGWTTCSWDAECKMKAEPVPGQTLGCANSAGQAGYCGCVDGGTNECTCLMPAPEGYQCHYTAQSETGWLWFPTERSKDDGDILKYDSGDKFGFFESALNRHRNTNKDSMALKRDLSRRAGRRVEWKLGHLVGSPADEILKKRDAIPLGAWSYKDSAAWAKTWPECASKERPSPINVEGNIKDAPAQTFSFDAWYPVMNMKGVALQNDGHKIFFKPPASTPFRLRLNNAARSGSADIGLIYELVSIEFHTKSEHTWGGKPLVGEMHLVHKLLHAVDANHKQVTPAATAEPIVILVWGFGSHNGGHRKIFRSLDWDKLPAVGASHVVATDSKIKFGKFINNLQKKAVTNYLGSFTSPPCSPVEYYVFEKYGAMGPDTAAQLEKALGGANARPVQAAGSKTNAVRSSKHRAPPANVKPIPANVAAALGDIAKKVQDFKKKF